MVNHNRRWHMALRACRAKTFSPTPNTTQVFMVPAVMVVLYLRDLGVPAGVAFVAGICANLLLPVLPVLAALVVAARAML